MSLLHSLKSMLSRKVQCRRCGRMVPAAEMRTVHYSFHGTKTTEEICEFCAIHEQVQARQQRAQARAEQLHTKVHA